MIYFQVNSNEFSPAIIDLIAESLLNGQVVILPTDTIYGFSCLASDPQAIKRIYKLKKRDSKKPFIILASSLAMVKKYAFVSSRQELFLKKIWSGQAKPTTVILRHRGLLPRELTSGSDSLAIRLPKNSFLIKIIKKVQAPIVSTSLNLSGRETIRNLQEISYYFPNKQNRPDLAIDIGECRRLKSSRLIDLRDDDNYLVLRK